MSFRTREKRLSSVSQDQLGWRPLPGCYGNMLFALVNFEDEVGQTQSNFRLDLRPITKGKYFTSVAQQHFTVNQHSGSLSLFLSFSHRYWTFALCDHHTGSGGVAQLAQVTETPILKNYASGWTKKFSISFFVLHLVQDTVWIDSSQMKWRTNRCLPHCLQSFVDTVQKGVWSTLQIWSGPA